jgi:hypothetical protein
MSNNTGYIDDEPFKKHFLGEKVHRRNNSGAWATSSMYIGQRLLLGSRHKTKGHICQYQPPLSVVQK